MIETAMVGGVALYIRDSINYKIRNDLAIDSLEIVTVEIFKPKSKSFLLGIDHQIRQSIYSKIIKYVSKKWMRKTKKRYVLEISIATGYWEKDNLTLLD